MLSEDAKAIVASNLTTALAVLVASGWKEDDKEGKHPFPKKTIGVWYDDFLGELDESK